MADEWIKMRGDMVDHPKVIAMTRLLYANNDFRNWMHPGSAASFSGDLVRMEALRCVTTALLLRVWSASRAHGVFVEDDLVLAHNCVEDLDEMAGVPGFGLAMLEIGWVKQMPRGKGIFLPNFKEFNVPKTAKEKQQDYRDRQKEGDKTVTSPLPKRGNEKRRNVTSREDKNREELYSEPKGSGASAPLFESQSQAPPPKPEKPRDPVKDEIWREGRRLLVEVSGMEKEKAGDIIGSLVKQHGQIRMLEAIRHCIRESIADPKTYLLALQKAPANKQSQLENQNSNVAAEWAQEAPR